MSPFETDAVESSEPAQVHRYGNAGQRWRVLAFTVILGSAVVLMLLVGLRSAYSDDGGGGDPSESDDSHIWQYPFGDKTLLKTTKSTPGDMLTNGDMDQMGLYWKYPNHYIAGEWFEWFSTRLPHSRVYQRKRTRICAYACEFPENAALGRQLCGWFDAITCSYALHLLSLPGLWPLASWFQ